jgi:hypothetical protein
MNKKVILVRYYMLKIQYKWLRLLTGYKKSIPGWEAMNTQVTNSVKTQAVDTWLNPKPQCVCVCVCGGCSESFVQLLQCSLSNSQFSCNP